MSKEAERGLKKLDDGRYRLSDGMIMTEAELDQAMGNYFEREELKYAENRAKGNQFDLGMLYSAIAGASSSGVLLRDQATQRDVMAAIDHAHGEVMGETYSGAVADVEHMSAVTLAAMMQDINAIERHYRDTTNQGLSVPQALVRSPILMAPSFIEGLTPKNLIQAMIVASIVKWIPLRGYDDDKTFFVTPASKDWDVLRRLEATPKGQDWINMAYAQSERDASSTFPNFS